MSPGIIVITDTVLALLMVTFVVLTYAASLILGSGGDELPSGLQAKIAALEARRVSLEAQVSDLNAKLTVLSKSKEEAAEVRRQLDALTREHAKLVVLEGQERAKLEELTGQLKVAKDAAEKAGNEASAAHTDGDAARTALADANAQIDSLHRKMPTELLGLTNQMSKVVFVVDSSGSMAVDNKWNQTVDRIQSWMNLFPVNQAAMVVFSDRVSCYPSDVRWVDASVPQERTKLVDTVRDLRPGGMTNTLEALRTAYLYNDADAIVLFTDGHPELRGDTRATMLLRIKDIEEFVHAQNPPKPIICVAVGKYDGDGEFIRFLVDLSTISGGTFLAR
jgi:von Willebrand factor type A domain